MPGGGLPVSVLLGAGYPDPVTPDDLSGGLPTRSPGAGAEGSEPPALPLRTGPVVLVGVALWAVALVVTLAVPALHTGDRHWWPWTCVAAMALGLLGYAYLRRGRGNAEGAS